MSYTCLETGLIGHLMSEQRCIGQIEQERVKAKGQKMRGHSQQRIYVPLHK